MCPDRKQILNAITLAGWLALLGAGPAAGGEASAGSAGAASAGGVTIGATHGGITDEAYVTAPPNWLYVVERERGSFLDCGEGQDQRMTDAAGRDAAALSCGVTLTETIVIPAASTSARIIIHY
jgi:hypothetical protein